MTTVEPERAQHQHTAARRLFADNRPRSIDHPSVRALLLELARKCSAAFAAAAGHATTFEIEAVDQIPLQQAVSQAQSAVTAACHIPECSDLALVLLDRRLFFRALDAMYGGDASERREAPERALTQLERLLAARVSAAVLGQLGAVLAGHGKLTCLSGQYVEPGEMQSLRGGRKQHVCVRLRAVELDDRLIVLIPGAALARVSEQTGSAASEDADAPEPEWSSAFERQVSAVGIALTAAVDGPQMLLGDIARLAPGALIELDGEALRKVLVASADQPVFVGRLGQSVGLFTVLIEQAVAAGDNCAGPLARSNS